MFYINASARNACSKTDDHGASKQQFCPKNVLELRRPDISERRFRAEGSAIKLKLARELSFRAEKQLETVLFHQNHGFHRVFCGRRALDKAKLFNVQCGQQVCSGGKTRKRTFRATFSDRNSFTSCFPISKTFQSRTFCSKNRFTRGFGPPSDAIIQKQSSTFAG